jgi:hypothetical protein
MNIVDFPCCANVDAGWHTGSATFRDLMSAGSHPKSGVKAHMRYTEFGRSGKSGSDPA